MDLTTLAQGHLDRIWQAARAETGDDHAAWDCVQEAFATALAAKRGPSGDPVAWLCGVARNHARHWARGRSRLQGAMERLAERRHTVRSRPDPAALRDALAQLPLKQRDAVVLRYLTGRSFREVAEAQGISETAAKARVRRGLAALRARLGAAPLALLLVREAEAGTGIQVLAGAAAGVLMKKYILVGIVMLALLGAGTGLILSRDAPSPRTPPPHAEMSDLAGVVPASVSQPPGAQRAEAESAELGRTETRVEAPGGSLGELNETEGRVIWEDGTPVAGVLLELFSSPLDYTALVATQYTVRVASRAVSDDDGRFRVSWAPGFLWALRVSVDDGPRASITEPPEGGFLSIVLARQGTALDVEVVQAWDGQPAAGAGVQLKATAGRGNLWWRGGTSPIGWRRTTWTDERGRCRLEGIASGRATLRVEPRDGEPVVDHRVDIVEGATAKIRLAVGRGQTVKGLVLDDATGAHVAGATVWLGALQIREDIETRTDARGAFVLGPLPWDKNVRRSVSVWAEHYATARKLIGHVDRDGAVEEVEFRLRRSAALRLRCVTGAGGPRGNVLIIAHSDEVIAGEHIDIINRDWKHSVTNEDGFATIEDLAPGETGLLECWVDGVRAAERTLALLRPAEVRDLGTIVVGPAKDLRGIVRTAEGEPAAGSFVVLEPHNPLDDQHHALAFALISPRRGARVGVNGRFVVRGLMPGVWDLLVHGGGHPRLLRVGLSVTEQGEDAPLRLQLPVAVALEGRVVDPSGDPVAHARIDFQRSHPVAPNLVESVVADEQGRFSIPGFTREDEGVPVWATSPGGGRFHTKVEVTPRDGAVEIRLDLG